MSAYDNWKCTDPSLENEWDWIVASEEYENSPEYETDLAQWLKEAKEEDPDETYTEDDYRLSSAYENVIEYRLNDGAY